MSRPQTPAIIHHNRRPRLGLWLRQFELSMGKVMNRKMMMISYEDEIDTASHRKQRRRRRPQESNVASERPDQESDSGPACWRCQLTTTTTTTPTTPIDGPNAISRIESSPSKMSVATIRTRFREKPRRSTRHLRLLLMLALIPLALLLTLPMVMTRTETAPDQPQANSWRTSIANGQLNGPLEETAPMEDDSFGSRLAAAASPRLDEAESNSAWNDNSAASLQKAFMSRQGQLGELDQQQQAARRQARQPAPSQMQQQQQQRAPLQSPARPRQQPLGALPPNGFVLQQQPQGLNQNQLQERFQRLRGTPAQNVPGAAFEQFPRPQNGANFNPNGAQFGPTPQQQQQQANQRLQLGVPTLSAFDLSSLTNLANNQPNGNNQPLQPTFRRIPPQSPQQQQQQPVPIAPPQASPRQQLSNFGSLSAASQFFDQNQNNRQAQQSNSNNNNNNVQPATELPFIRQVFRPAAAPVGDESAPLEPARAQSSSGRPTPPPLFVPSRQQMTGQQPPSNGSRRPLESGFSPIQSNRVGPTSQAEGPTFFEPTGSRTSPQANSSQPQRQQQQQQQAGDSVPVTAGQRKPPIRRPSQRPHVPSANGSQPQPAHTLTSVQQQAAAEVIRLATNAVQAANEGLASSSLTPLGPLAATAFTTGVSAQGNEFAAATTTTTAATTTTTSSTTTPSSSTGSGELGRRAVSQAPPRTSANFFQTLTSAATSLPSSFSPALPINQAVGATGGRRRIPVRVGAFTGASSQRNPQATTPLALSSAQQQQQQQQTTTTPPSTSAPRFASTARENVGVRRPEMQDFYETIGSSPALGLGMGAVNSVAPVGSLSESATPLTTQIDGFGTPQRPKQPLTTTESNSETFGSTTSAESADKSLPTTTTDLYGSRLTAGQQQDFNRQQAEQVVDRQRQSQLDSTNRLQQVDRRPALKPALVELAPDDQDDRRAQTQRETTNKLQQIDRQPQQPVLVPVTYVTTLTYLTTVLHGTHTLETSHEAVERSTRMATMNAQLINQIEHSLPLIEPTATVSLSSRIKGKGTTWVNLKSAVSAYNQELVEALNAAGGVSSTTPPTQIQPTQVASLPVVSPTQSVFGANRPQQPVDSRQQAASVVSSGSGGSRQRPKQPPVGQSVGQQRPSRTVDLRELQELKKRLATEYLYSYTLRPVDQPDQLLATSVRSELVVNSQLVPDGQDRLMLMAALSTNSNSNSNSNGANLIDSEGLLRVPVPNGKIDGGELGTSQINLGSTIGKESPQTMTEVNMNVATYLKFEGISNVLVEMKPSAGNVLELERPSFNPLESSLIGKSQLDTSFNIHMTLGNALEHLQHQPAASQQTPALESASVTQPPTTKPEQDLLRSSAVAAQPQSSSVEPTPNLASSSSVARSQLRSRVASSRFRSQFQTLQPARAANTDQAASSSPVAGIVSSAVVTDTPQVAPSASSGLRQLRPMKSRILRPSLLKPISTNAPDQMSGDNLASPSPNLTSSAQASPSTRSTKARFVVVTRTGQFGIRASAISSLASAAASASSDQSPTLEPSATPLQTVRVSSRFSKPNRFRGANSQSVQATRVRGSNGDLLQTTPVASLPARQQQVLEPGASVQPQQAGPTSESANKAPSEESSSSSSAAAAAVKPDGAASVIVTYFTTTTHTIPFELNSETVFTTIEETNSRIATEYMSDLSSHFIEPTPVANLPKISQTVAPPSLEVSQPGQTQAQDNNNNNNNNNNSGTSTEGVATSGQEQQTSSSTAQATTSNSEQQAATTPASENQTTGDQQQQQQQSPKQLIEPSFATTLKTQTHFTTFTYFTTYSAGSDSQTVQSSESTTSNVIVQTISSQIEPSATLRPSGSQIEMTNSAVLQEQSTGSPLDVAVTKTLLSTMTYYGTVYNGTQTSLTPILDVSTRLLTVDANGGAISSSSPPGFSYLNSDLFAPSSTQAPGQQQQQQSTVSMMVGGQQPTASSDMTNEPASSTSATPPLEINPTQQVDRITRTRSMYTTLTHFITFFSGTKTQLSTIQEISPTVVTEYIDRTVFEQQLAESSAAGSSISSSAVLVTIPSSSVLMGGSSISGGGGGELATTTTTTSTTPTANELSGDEQQASTTTSVPSSSQNDQSGSSEAATTTTTTAANTKGETTATTQASSTTASEPAEPVSVSVSSPASSPNAENQQRQGQDSARVLASSDQSAPVDLSVESKQATNIIELSDLIASNSSQSGRVALTGNLGAAIKDIVQLLAGNKTQQQLQQQTSDRLPINVSSLPPVSSTEPVAVTRPQQDQSSTSSGATAAAGSSSSSTPKPSSSPKPRLFGNKQRLNELHGSITSPSTPTISSTTGSMWEQDSSSSSAGTAGSQQARATPELNLQHVSTSAKAAPTSGAAATIFFGDDSQDEHKKQIKTVWPGAQSTVYVTSVEPSTRSLTVTTTKVYYTRDAQLTITSSYTSVIAPRTFVSTIMGTRTLVNQLNGPSSTAVPTLQQQQQQQQANATNGSRSDSARPSATRPADTQNAAVANRYKQQKQQQQQVAQEQRKLVQQQQLAAAKQQQARAKLEQQQQQQLAMANINQCQPACKASSNEVCKFTPALTGDGHNVGGAQGTFACACRPGYFMMLNSVGQRQCQEVQSYVIMLRLLQVGDQQISFKRELQNRSSPEFKQFSRIVREHVKRAYMTSDLIRDRYVGSDILNFARTLSVSSGLSSQSLGAQPSQGKQPLALNASQLDPLNAGVIVNMTIHLQQPTSSQTSTSQIGNDIQVDETMLKEELTKKLNMRQAAALAAAAAATTSTGTTSPTPAESAAGAVSGQQSSNSTGSGQQLGGDLTQMGANQTDPLGEPLPNPNALFLADVEQVQDLDECASATLNDCHEGAVCLNEPGSYKCDCREYPDLNPLNPGRQCANELKSCDYCNNRGDCLRVPSLIGGMNANMWPTTSTNNSSTPVSQNMQPGNGRGQSFSTVCQCHRIYLGRRCEINGLLLATLLPILAILLIISVCLIIYCCRRWRRRSSLSKGFRNIGSFGPNHIGSTLDRKAMLESSSESSDTHQRHQAANHHHHLLHQAAAGQGGGHQLRNATATGMGAHTNLALYEASSEPTSSQESSPRQMSTTRTGGGIEINSASSYLHHLTPPNGVAAAGTGQTQAGSLNPYCSSIPPQIVIPRARHNQVNYAVHRGQVYMW